jgi:regulator of sigma E protease
MSEEERQVSFHFKKLYQRAAIVFAGPFANFIFAILILATFFYLYGEVERKPVVSDVMENSAAAQAGLEKGDMIVGVDGNKISSFQDVVIQVVYSAGETLEFEVLRRGEIVKLSLTPRLEDRNLEGAPLLDDNGEPMKVYRIGVKNTEKVIIREHGLGSALVAGGRQSKMIVVQSLRGIRQMIVGSRSVKELSGPVGISQIAGKAAKMGLDRWVQVMALISLSLG